MIERVFCIYNSSYFISNYVFRGKVRKDGFINY